MEQVAGHLNYKNRESKLAQKDSTELFQTLYVLQKTRNPAAIENGGDDPEAEDLPFMETGIVSEIRENGFFVFVPRFGIRGPVYLKEKSGEISIPLSALKQSGAAAAAAGGNDHLVTISGCEMDTDLMTQISVKVPPQALGSHAASLPNISTLVQFRLFDKVKVALRLKKSLAHRHTIYMTLIGLDHQSTATASSGTGKAGSGRGATPIKGHSGRLFKKAGEQLKQDEVKRIAQQDPSLAPLQQRDLIQGIQEGQQQQKKGGKNSRKQQQAADPEEVYYQSRPESSLYNLIESFDRFRIVESNESPSS
jgi:DIS3-like exonuclease 1